MAYEAELRDRRGDAYNFTCANGAAINKGTLLKLTDPRTAAASDGSSDVLAGIAAADKIASDGITSIGVFRDGIFEMYASGAIGVGNSVMSVGADNHVVVAGAAASGAAILGTALETASAGEQINVQVNLG